MEHLEKGGRTKKNLSIDAAQAIQSPLKGSCEFDARAPFLTASHSRAPMGIIQRLFIEYRSISERLSTGP